MPTLDCLCFHLTPEVLDQYGIQVPLSVISLSDAWAETSSNFEVSASGISLIKSEWLQVCLSVCVWQLAFKAVYVACLKEMFPVLISACVSLVRDMRVLQLYEACVRMVCVLVFVQCGRGWSGRSIGNKWIQINMKPGSEGERRRDWKRVSGVMRHRRGGGEGGGVLVDWRGWCVTSSTATKCTLGKDHSLLQPKPQWFEVTDG